MYLCKEKKVHLFNVFSIFSLSLEYFISVKRRDITAFILEQIQSWNGIIFVFILQRPTVLFWINPERVET